MEIKINKINIKPSPEVEKPSPEVIKEPKHEVEEQSQTSQIVEETKVDQPAGVSEDSNVVEELKVVEENSKNKKKKKKKDKKKESKSSTLAIDKDNIADRLNMTSAEREKYIKKHKALKRKKNVFFLFFLLMMIAIVAFGTYKTFFEKEKTDREIATSVNQINQTTSFPKDGVQGYITKNISNLVKGKIAVDQQVEGLSIGIPVVTKVVPKTDSLANVYFYLPVKTSKGESQINCMIPLMYKNGYYHPTEDIIVTPVESSTANIKTEENEIFSFKDIAKESNENTDKAKVYCDNFFKILYSNGNIAPYYTGETKLVSNGFQYKEISKFVLYKKDNKNGYNAECMVSVTDPTTGTVYNTHKYIKIVRNGDSWIIKMVL